MKRTLRQVVASVCSALLLAGMVGFAPVFATGLGGSLSIDLNPTTGQLTANTSAVTNKSSDEDNLSYVWSRAGVTGSGIALDASSLLGTEITLTVSDSVNSDNDIDATITVYSMAVVMSSNTGSDNAALADATSKFVKNGDTVTINYTLDNTGTLSNGLAYTGGTVSPVSTAGTSTSTYTVADTDATDGVITLTATFTHTNYPNMDGTVKIGLDDTTGVLSADISGITNGSGAFTYAWTGDSVTGTTDTVNLAKADYVIGKTITLTVGRADLTGTTTTSIKVCSMAAVVLAGDEDDDDAALDDAPAYVKDGDTVDIEYTIDAPGTTNTLKFSTSGGIIDTIGNDGSSSVSGTFNYTVNSADANASGVIAITATFTHGEPTALTAANVKTWTDKKAVYTGSLIAMNDLVAVGVSSGAVSLVLGQDYIVDFWTSAAMTNAGKYVATVSGIGNYTGDVVKEYTIEKKALAVADFAALAPVTYNGYERSITDDMLTLVSPMTERGALKSVTYKTNPGGQSVTAPKNAGVYTAAAIFADGKNFKGGTVELPFTIDAAAAPTPENGSVYAAAGEEETYTFDLKTLLPAGVTASDIAAYTTSAATGTNSSLISEIAVNSNGIVTFKVANSGNDTDVAAIPVGFTFKTGANYTGTMNANINITVTAKTPTVISGYTVTSRPYDGTAMVLGGRVTFTPAPANPSDMAVSQEWLDSAKAVLPAAPTKAGIYYVSVSAIDAVNDAYIAAPLLIPFEITKKEITLKAENASVTQNAASLPTLTVSAIGLVSPDTWASVKATDLTVTTTATDTATTGTFPITFTGGTLNAAAGANYEITNRTNGTLTVSSSGGGGGGGGGGSTVTTPPTTTTPGTGTGTTGTTGAGGYSDTAGHWAADGINYVTNNSLMNGTGGGKFSPDSAMTRAMFVTVLARAAKATANGAASFGDVPSGSWFANGAAWASENGVTSGIGGGLFGPNMNISREQLAVMMYNYAKLMNLLGDAPASDTVYPDAASVSAWAKDAMAWANAAGLITGKTGGVLDPQGNATRAEVATILMRFLRKI